MTILGTLTSLADRRLHDTTKTKTCKENRFSYQPIALISLYGSEVSFSLRWNPERSERWPEIPHHHLNNSLSLNYTIIGTTAEWGEMLNCSLISSIRLPFDITTPE